MNDAVTRPPPAWGAIIAAMALGLTLLTTGTVAVWALATGAAQGAQTASALSGLRGDLKAGLDELKAQIAGFPDISARLTLAERQLRDAQVRDGAQDSAIDTLRQRVYEIGAEVEGMKRASSVRLPGAPSR